MVKIGVCMALPSKDSLKAFSKFVVDGKEYGYFSLKKAAEKLGFKLSKLPYSLRVLFENALRSEDGTNNDVHTLQAFADWIKTGTSDTEVAFMPARVLMQDFTGVPAVVDLAAMRDAMKKLGGDPLKINPLIPVDLVIDHSVQVDFAGDGNAFSENVSLEMKRNKERYEFLKWGQKAFKNFRVVPPGTGICHQVNLEYLAQVAFCDGDMVYPDTLVGTDSHTTMINGLSVLGWGVGGIEAEAAMLGQSLPMILPEVVVGKFVEFFGPGLAYLPLADRATVANMAPEYGATCGFFPVDAETIKYLHLSARSDHQTALVEHYAKLQDLWRDDAEDPRYTDVVELDLSHLEPSIAGPKRPQDRVSLSKAASDFQTLPNNSSGKPAPVKNGDIVIAAITSCTNTSNPSVMLAAGLLAKKACELGINTQKWVKASLAPGSKVVTEYLNASGLDVYLNALGFHLVGYGCTTCIGNSGPLAPEIDKAITEHNITAVSVLSGNRNFEGRIHPQTVANYLASPPLVVAYALAGNMNIDITKEPIGHDKNGKAIYLKDVWPSNEDIAAITDKVVTSKLFSAKYSDVFAGDGLWQSLKVTDAPTYSWDAQSTYIKNPPYFVGISDQLHGAKDIKNAKILAIFGDSITTDHISPAGSISIKSPAAAYLISKGVERVDFNSYGARRGNDEVMTRGTFANIRIKNEMCTGIEGGVTKLPSGEQVSIYDAAMHYQKNNTSLVIIAGKEYGTGSSRDWAAKGTRLLGVKAVIAESFERIHRSNLVGMGVMPLIFTGGMTRADLALDGTESIDILGLESVSPHKIVEATIGRHKIKLELQIFTKNEVEYTEHGGILHRVLRGFK
jgi:aconitate hydratase